MGKEFSIILCPHLHYTLHITQKMTERIIISGFGGQGIMFLGKLISWAAMLKGHFVTFLPAYGAEVRGGTSHCSVIISSEEIASACIDEADVLIAMNEPSLVKFLPKAKRTARVFVNASMLLNNKKNKYSRPAENLRLFAFSDLASELGNIRAANMLALGAYLKKSKMLSLDDFLKLLPRAFKDNKELLSINEKALKAGMKL